MTITGIITAILIGIVVGVLGRLLVPGKQPIGMLVTILVGIVSAFIGHRDRPRTRYTDCNRRYRLARTAGSGSCRGTRRRTCLVADGTQAHRRAGEPAALRNVPLERQLSEPGGIPWPPGLRLFGGGRNFVLSASCG